MRSTQSKDGIRKVNLQEAYNGSYYTITGAGGDLKAWVEGYNKMLAEQKIGRHREWFTAKGKEINTQYGLTGRNAFKARLSFLFFPLDDLDIGKLAIFKLRMGDRWFDDIVDNSRRHQREMEGRA